ADAKAEIFAGVEPGGSAVLNRDNAQYERLAAAARAAGISRIVGFGEHAEAEARLVKLALLADGSTVRATILGDDVTYKLGAPGRHVAINSLAVLAAAKLAGADLALAAIALAALEPPSGRGARVALTLAGGTATLIDESYNANPASMRAALALLAQTPVGARGRRIAVIGDMLELGPQGAAMHAALAEMIADCKVDLVFCSGPLMRALWDALPAALRGAYAPDSAALQPQVLAAIEAGDAVMIKGSLGSRMGPIVRALVNRYTRPESRQAALAQG
ncbi:MAG TPA: Mur ligase family protein, partial [Xanthobacteraceae bacterium]